MLFLVIISFLGRRNLPMSRFCLFVYFRFETLGLNIVCFLSFSFSRLWITRKLIIKLFISISFRSSMLFVSIDIYVFSHYFVSGVCFWAFFFFLFTSWLLQIDKFLENRRNFWNILWCIFYRDWLVDTFFVVVVAVFFSLLNIIYICLWNKCTNQILFLYQNFFFYYTNR